MGAGAPLREKGAFTSLRTTLIQSEGEGIAKYGFSTMIGAAWRGRSVAADDRAEHVPVIDVRQYGRFRIVGFPCRPTYDLPEPGEVMCFMARPFA